MFFYYNLYKLFNCNNYIVLNCNLLYEDIYNYKIYKVEKISQIN